MVKFAHIADVHLGGWKQQPLQDLNSKSFKIAVKTCIQEKVDFILIAGDLFDSAFPPIDILKETFAEFKKIKEAGIPCFIIAGSHDYSVSGKTFLDVLEKAGFCKNVEDFEEKNEKIILNPTIYKGVAIYGYPGKTSGLEINELRKISFNESPGMFKIFMLHTTIDKVKGNLPIDALETDNVPEADYYALGHIHMDFQYENFVYPGPIFPNNFKELEDLEHGRFYIVNTSSESKENSLKRIDLKIKDVVCIEVNVKNTYKATDEIISEINKKTIEDKIVLLRVKGIIESGKHSDIKFSQIEDFAEKKGAYFLLRNTHELKTKDAEIEIEINETENIEEETLKDYSKQNPSKLNEFIPSLISALSAEKQEGETTESFKKRIFEESQKILKF